jgi:hypothetical protein
MNKQCLQPEISMANTTANKEARELSSDPKLMLTLDEAGVISVKEFSWVSGDLIGCTALQTDGSRRLFAENASPTEREFYGLDESIRTLAFAEKKLRVLKATGLGDDRDELPWLEYDSNGEPVEGQVESDLLDASFDKIVSSWDDRYESWGARTASQYAAGFELMDLLSAKDRNDLGLCEVDWGGPASSVPCVAMTASVQKFNQLMEARRLPYVMVDDKGPTER